MPIARGRRRRVPPLGRRRAAGAAAAQRRADRDAARTRAPARSRCSGRTAGSWRWWRTRAGRRRAWRSSRSRGGLVAVPGPGPGVEPRSGPGLLRAHPGAGGIRRRRVHAAARTGAGAGSRATLRLPLSPTGAGYSLIRGGARSESRSGRGRVGPGALSRRSPPAYRSEDGTGREDRRWHCWMPMRTRHWCGSAIWQAGRAVRASSRTTTGTVVTSHEAVDGAAQLVLQPMADGAGGGAAGGGGWTCVVAADAITPLPEAGLALVRTGGFGPHRLAPLPIVRRAGRPRAPRTALGGRLARRHGRRAGLRGDVHGHRRASISSTKRWSWRRAGGREALRLGGPAVGGPVLDARTGAVLGVLGTALHPQAPGRVRTGESPSDAGRAASRFRCARSPRPRPTVRSAALLERNAATVPAYGSDLNPAGARHLAEWRWAPPAAAAVARAGRTARDVRGVHGASRRATGRRRTRARRWWASRAPGGARSSPGSPPAGPRARRPPRPSGCAARSCGPTTTAVARRGRARAARPPAGPSPGRAVRPVTRRTPPRRAWPGAAARGRASAAGAARRAGGDAAGPGAASGWPGGPGDGRLAAYGRGAAGGRLPPRVLGAGRCALPARPAAPAAPSGARAARLRGARRPLRGGGGARPCPLRPAGRRTGRAGRPPSAGPAAARGGRRGAPQGGRGRTGRRGIGAPDRHQIFDAYLDLVCLRIAVRLAAAHRPALRGTAVRRLAAQVAGQVHEAARRCSRPRAGRAGPYVLRGDLPVAARLGLRGARPRACWSRPAPDTASRTRSSRTGCRAPMWTSICCPSPGHRVGPVVQALLLLGRREGAVQLTFRLAELVPMATAPAAGAPAPHAVDGRWWAARAAVRRAAPGPRREAVHGRPAAARRPDHGTVPPGGRLRAHGPGGLRAVVLGAAGAGRRGPDGSAAPSAAGRRAAGWGGARRRTVRGGAARRGAGGAWGGRCQAMCGAGAGRVRCSSAAASSRSGRLSSSGASSRSDGASPSRPPASSDSCVPGPRPGDPWPSGPRAVLRSRPSSGRCRRSPAGRLRRSVCRAR